MLVDVVVDVDVDVVVAVDGVLGLWSLDLHQQALLESQRTIR